VPGDLRKFCEQQGDILQWDQSNKNYILTHGVSGVDWRFYKHPLPEHVYDIYMKYWKVPNSSFSAQDAFLATSDLIPISASYGPQNACNNAKKNY
jgi:hypothetical protein